MYFFRKLKFGLIFWKLFFSKTDDEVLTNGFSKTDKKFWKMEYDYALEFGCRRTKPTPMNIKKV